MGIDIGRELSVRAIAHNIGYRFGSAIGGTDEEIAAHALRLAALFDTSEDGRQALAAAAIGMWRAAGQQETTTTEGETHA